MRHWLAQKPGTVYTRAQWPDEVARRLGALTGTGCSITVQQLPAASTHVALVSAQHEEMHFTATASAACASFTGAVIGAIDKLEAKVRAWMQGHRPRIKLAAQAATAEHHFGLYGLKRHFKRADRMLFPPPAPTASYWPQDLADHSLESLLGHFSAQGLQPVAVDITPERSVIDQGRTRLTVVKALVPGMLPVSFGHQQEPLGMVPRSHPGSKFPHPFSDFQT